MLHGGLGEYLWSDRLGWVVPTFKKREWRVCSNYFSLPENVYSRVVERKLQRTVEPLIQEEQYTFRPGYETLDNFCTLWCLLGKAPKSTHSVYMYFADLERAYDRDSWGPLGDAAGVCGTRLFSACMNTVRAMVTFSY